MSVAFSLCLIIVKKILFYVRSYTFEKYLIVLKSGPNNPYLRMLAYKLV